eukprot:UN10963
MVKYFFPYLLFLGQNFTCQWIDVSLTILIPLLAIHFNENLMTQRMRIYHFYVIATQITGWVLVSILFRLADHRTRFRYHIVFLNFITDIPQIIILVHYISNR